MSLDILVAFAFGIVYGFRHRGKEDRAGLLRDGAKWGLVIGLGIGLLDYVATENVSRFISLTQIGVLGILVITVVFVVGTVLGDFLEVKLKK